MTISAIRLDEYLGDLNQKCLVLLLAWAKWESKPIIICAPANLKCAAHLLDAKVGAVILDEQVSYLTPLLKMAIAFFRISFSSLRS